MNIAQLQIALNSKGQKPPLIADGISGKNTMRAVDALLDKAFAIGWQNWSDARRRLAAEQIIYRDAKIEVGAIDGLEGEQTRYARSVYNARLANAGKPDQNVENWRDVDIDKPLLAAPAKAVQWPRQADVPTFFGAYGQSQVMLELPFPMRIAWDPEKTVTRFSCHAKIHVPLKIIWKNTIDHYGHEQIKKLRLDMFGGCLNVRKMRGGSAMSMHSWGIAMDIDPDRNQLKWGADKAQLDDAPYKPFWQFVADEGAISLGQARNYDWMHFQFARL